MSAPQVGDSIDNRYELCRQLGDGQESVTFEAAHRFTGRRVVLEFLPGWRHVPEAELRRACSAFAVGRIRHPNLVEVSDAGSADGVPYLVTALVAGRSLEGLLAARGSLSAAESTKVARQVALALEALHHHGLAHADVGSANVWVVRSPLGDEQIELRNRRMTYGVLSLGPPGDPPQSAGGFLPSPASAPGPASTVQSDLWNVGVLLFECLTGSPPRSSPEGAERAALLAVRPETPVALARVVARCLSPVPAERYSSARELIAGLEATRLTGGSTTFLGGSQQSLPAVAASPERAPRDATHVPSPISAPPPSPPGPASSPPREAVDHLARRRVPRAAYSTPVRLIGHHGLMEGRVEDISTRGVLVIAASPLEVGTVVQLRFAIPDSGVIVLCAGILRWVRIAPASRRAAMGFEFQATPDDLRAAVEAYVARQ